MTRMTDSKIKRLYVRRRPSFSATGTTVVTVGRSSWKVAPDWRIHYELDGQLCWVELGHGDVRLLSESGEIRGIPQPILDAARRLFFP
jgi:hypothetical protein